MDFEKEKIDNLDLEETVSEEVEKVSADKELSEEILKRINDAVEENKKQLNVEFLELINKKSIEASELLDKKKKELEEKYNEEFEKSKKFLYEDQLSQLVEIISQLEKVLLAPVNNPELKNYLVGFQMFLNQFQNLLSEFNIVEIIPNVGDEFNPEIMSALNTENALDKDKNKVLIVYSKGFSLNDRIIKLAEVKVGV